MSKKPRDYRRERALAIKRGETGTGHNAGDSTRHRARRKVEKRIGRKLSPNEVVDHKKPLKSGGGNGDGNLRVSKLESNAAHGGRIGDSSKKGTKKKLKGALSK